MLNCVRVWIRDDHMSDSPQKKKAIDFITQEGEEIIKDIIREGFKYVLDSENNVLRYIPSTQVLTAYFYGNTDEKLVSSNIPEIMRI